MTGEELSQLKQQYDIARHHAWAGTALLSVLLAIRILLEISTYTGIPDLFFLTGGIILIIYILISVSFTYKYRSGLTAAQQIVHVHTDPEVEQAKIAADLEKERLKIEKKKAKAEAKKAKKQQK